MILKLILALVMVAVVVVLFSGIVSFAVSPQWHARHGNKLMRWRVGLQGIAVVVFVLILLVG